MSSNKLADALGENITDVREMEYQPGHWSPRVWVAGNTYYTVTRSAKPPKVESTHSESHWHGDWELIPPEKQHRHRPGTFIWQSVPDKS